MADPTIKDVLAALASMRSETKDDIAKLNAKLDSVRTELDAKLDSVRTELITKITTSRVELRDELAALPTPVSPPRRSS